MALADLENSAGKYVTFQLSRQYFAIRSDRVRQILPIGDVRSTTQRIPYMCGSVAANGRLIPVLDVRDRLAANIRPARANGSVLVVSLDERCALGIVGLIADKLSEVVHLKETDIRGSIAQMRIDGRPYGRPKILVEVESLLQPDEWDRVRAVLL